MDFNVTVNIDLERFISSGKNIPNLDSYIQDGIDDAKVEFAKRLEEKVLENLMLYGLGGSRLAGDVSVRTLNDGFSIVVDNEYFSFVEYGTGIVGLGFQHPKAAEDGWEYDTNHHGDSGWWYPSSEDDPNPTKKLTENGWWAWTAGQASRPFMYKSWLWGTRSVNNIFRKHINRQLEKFKGDVE